MKHKVLGWTMDQWSIVLGRLNINEVPTVDSALQARREWLRKGYLWEPKEIIIGVEVARNWEAACDVFELPMPALEA